MKQYVTVYDLIQKLSIYPANTYVEFYIWVPHTQIEIYKKEYEKDDYIRFDAEQIDFKFDVNLNDSKTAIIIEMDAEEKE